MLYVIYGSDGGTVAHKFVALRDALLKKRPDASAILLSSETFTPTSIDELLYGQGLFGERMIVALSEVLSQDEAREAIIERLSDIAASENVFIFREGLIDAKLEKKLEKVAEKMQRYDAKETAKPEPFNRFALGDAYLAGKPGALWIALMRARRAGMVDEEIVGILFWQVRVSLLAARAKDAETAGIKPFAYSKAKRALGAIGEVKVARDAEALVAMTHDHRRGLVDLGVALERWALTGV